VAGIAPLSLGGDLRGEVAQMDDLDRRLEIARRAIGCPRGVP
jgi:hypothetical protein